MRDSRSIWRLRVDTGGTFSDGIAIAPDGTWRRAKALSTSALRGRVRRLLDERSLQIELTQQTPPGFLRGFSFVSLAHAPSDTSPTQIVAGHELDDRIELESALSNSTCAAIETRLREGGQALVELRSPEPAPLLLARLMTAASLDQPLPPMELRLATTRGTNALLERNGADVALFITNGFRDLLRIGTQQRPDLFALDIRKPAPLYTSVVETPGRIATHGAIIEELDLDAITPIAQRLFDSGVRSAAVALLNSAVEPAHEHLLRDRLRAIGFRVSTSSELAGSLGLLGRAQTAVIDAYLAPVIDSYFEEVERGLGPGGRLLVMTSAAGLAPRTNFRAKDSLLSGPAGGVAGAAAAGRRSGFDRVIGFDMGGTSTDVARYDGALEYVFEHTVGDATLLAPAVAIETVAAGGGSVCWFDGHALRVGPHSAAAWPGPACYGAGGPLTLTDVNLLLGRLDPARFGVPVDTGAARRAAEALYLDVRSADDSPSKSFSSQPTPARLTALDAMLSGFIDIANERMAEAIRRISVRRGYDVTEYALLAFGGAGPQHACAIAERLGITTVIVPRDASLLSAYGLGCASIERFAERQVLRTIDEMSSDAIQDVVTQLTAEAAAALREVASGDGASIESPRVIFQMRLKGQDSTLTVEPPPGSLDDLEAQFMRGYIDTYGDDPPPGRAIEIESIRVVVATGDSAAPEDDPHGHAIDAAGFDHGASYARDTGFASCDKCGPAVIGRDQLSRGDELVGPAIIYESHTATILENGWTASIDHAGALVLLRARDAVAVIPEADSSDAVPQAAQLELFTNRFRAIADEMGEMLRRTALSTNVKERLDFSCAVLDAAGELVANAPHIPVHLGALGLCTRRVAAALELQPGDVAITNHPAFGGSHLPDITLIAPVFTSDGKTRIGYVANRAHHAEIGGARPGSMPPGATRLVEEGIIIEPRYLVRREGDGVAGSARFTTRWGEIENLLRSGPYPSRAVHENLADLRAALASVHRGVNRLRDLASQFGVEIVQLQMNALRRRAADQVHLALRRLGDGRYEATECLDDGSPIRVVIDVRDGGATIDFTGSAPVHPGNFNATPAVVRSAVMYVLRLLIGEPLPLNEGLLAPVRIVTPPDTIVNPLFKRGAGRDPESAPAVVGGNVETSQRIVDAMLKALGLVACSQGTMNNVLFGRADFGYYETICGGAGAGPEFDGADAVHTHMTNTRITDPELLERRYPVRVRRFEIKAGSGGAGLRRGGDGVIREIEFLEPVSLSVLSQRRATGPYGLNGGSDGAPGAQRLIRASRGEVEELRGVDQRELAPGDRFIIETPGGGGWGAPKRK